MSKDNIMQGGTNIELFGSEFEQKIKEESAKTEPIWLNIDMNLPNLYIWKVMNFKLYQIKKENTGMFYEGDSYIVFNIFKESNGSLSYNIHFWLGNCTTADEMGTAAYKTVELDTYLSNKAKQFRECQDNESDLFRSYFPQGITYKLGGIESGFKKVQAFNYSNYKPLLYRVKNKSLTYIPFLNPTEDDTFVLDKGLELYIYHGKNSSHIERLLAEYNVSTIKDYRLNSEVKNVSDLETFSNLIKSITDHNLNTTSKLYRVTDTNIVECNGPLWILESSDTFLLSSTNTTFIWQGKNSSHSELLTVWKLAFDVTDKSVPICLIKEGYETELFKIILKQNQSLATAL